MEIGEKERSILYPEAKINFATLLCTFIDLEFPNETVKIKISFEKAVELIEEHEEKFERGYSEILKKYIIGGFLDYGYICLKKYEEKGIENVGSISKIIDTLEIQYHRQKIIMNKIPYDGINLYEQLDKDRRGYITVNSILDYIKRYDPSDKIVRVREREKMEQIREKLCNNIHQEDCIEENAKKNIMLENFMELFSRISGEDSFTYKTIDKLMKQKNKKQFDELLGKSYSKLRSNQCHNDESLFEKQFYSSKADAYKIVSTPIHNRMNDLKATDDDEYETIKKNAVFRKENELYTPRMYESKGRLDNVERHKNKTRTELILEQVNMLMLERVKNRLKYYNVIGL